MADIRINDLPAKTTLSDTDAFAVDGANETSKITFTDVAEQIVNKNFTFGTKVKSLKTAIEKIDTVNAGNTCTSVSGLYKLCTGLDDYQSIAVYVPVRSDLIISLFGGKIDKYNSDNVWVIAHKNSNGTVQFLAHAREISSGIISNGTITKTGGSSYKVNSSQYFENRTHVNVEPGILSGWTLSDDAAYVIYVLTNNGTSDDTIGVYYVYTTDDETSAPVCKTIKGLATTVAVITCSGNRTFQLKNVSNNSIAVTFRRLY